MSETVHGLQLVVERLSDGRPCLDSDSGEELMHVQPFVSIALGPRSPESPGTLYITSKRVVWLHDKDREKGYEVGFLSVNLHAVSRDPDAYPSPCIYTQIETGMEDFEEGSDVECNGDLDLSRITEMRLVPSDPNQLDVLFDIFCDCSELNPEPNDDDDEENRWFFGDQEMVDDGDSPDCHILENPSNPIGYGDEDEELARTVLELQINDQRFEDAEEMEDESLVYMK